MTGPGESVAARTFSRSGYRALLEAFLEVGYQPRTFTDLPQHPTAPPLVVRHDLDVDPTLGVPIGKIEADLGVRSTYLVLLTSPLYNPATPVNLACLRELADQGHDVGLHFDAAPYNTISQRDAALDNQVRLLERLLDGPVSVASFHRPGPAADNPELPGVTSAYEARFVDDLAYITDSGGGFRYGHPLDSDAFAQRRGVQLLTHPIWWGDQPLQDVAERLDAWHARHQHRMRNTLAANIRPYAEHLSNTRDHEL